MNQNPPPSNRSPALFIGIDWADQAHDCYIIDAQGNGQHQKLTQSPEAIDEWVKQMFLLSGGKPIAIIPEIGAALMRSTWIDDIRSWVSPHAADDGISLPLCALEPFRIELDAIVDDSRFDEAAATDDALQE